GSRGRGRLARRGPAVSGGAGRAQGRRVSARRVRGRRVRGRRVRDRRVRDRPAMTSAGPADAPRTRTPWRAAFFALAGLGLIAALAWVLFGSRLLVVRSVAVTGAHRGPAAEVLAAADVQAGTPLIRVNTGQIARRVEAIRQVASAIVARDWPDHLVITVRERVPVVAVRMAGGGYDLVDPDGVIVRWSQARPAR